MERRYSTAEAAAIIGISPKTLRNLLSKQRRGQPTGHEYLAHDYVGTRTVFRETILKAWMRAEHRRGLRLYEARHGSGPGYRYVSLEEWDGRGHRCEHCGLVFDWLYRLKQHRYQRKATGRCPVPMAAKEVDPAPRPRSKPAEKPKAKKPGRKRGRPPGKQKRKVKKAKPKPKPKRGKPTSWKKKPLSVVEDWADDEYIGT